MTSASLQLTTQSLLAEITGAMLYSAWFTSFCIYLG